jgi:transposase
VKKRRIEWVQLRRPFLNRRIQSIVFIDETSTNPNMVRTRGRCLKGKRLKGNAPFGHWKTQTFIAGLRCDGLTAPWVIDGPINRQAFDTYVEVELTPTLKKGDIVIMDNLSSHKSEKAKSLIRARGAFMLFLPPYSPDLNPIEMAFSKLKAHLRKAAVRTIDKLWKAIGNICKLFTPNECQNYFKAMGYEPI